MTPNAGKSFNLHERKTDSSTAPREALVQVPPAPKEILMNANMLDPFTLSFCQDAAAPEIPDVQDVLYALRLAEADRSYEFCLRNHMTYVMNVHLVAAKLASEVQIAAMLHQQGEATTRRYIAGKIVDLCPPEAKCLFVSAYVRAMRLAEREIPSTAGCDRWTRMQCCGCSKCAKRIRSEGSEW